MFYTYDLFISYANENRDIADYLVERIEKRGYKCFIAPRNIRTGMEYSSEIIKGITNSTAVLLVFSSLADKSHYVLREINSAVSRNKPIIPLRIEDILPSEAMEFYLGPCQWLDAFPSVLETHLERIENAICGLKKNIPEKRLNTFQISGPKLLTVDELGIIGMNSSSITMKFIEIDYLCIPSDRYDINDETEGTFDDWKQYVIEYGKDTSIYLVKEDEIIGYCDMYPVMKESYQELVSGKVIVRGSMIDAFCMGGLFDVYIAMLGIIPEEATQSNYLLIIDWIFNHLNHWKKEGILVNNIGISVYSELLEKFIRKLGFEYKCLNPANGKVFVTTISSLMCNGFVKKRYPGFYD